MERRREGKESRQACGIKPVGTAGPGAFVWGLLANHVGHTPHRQLTGRRGVVIVILQLPSLTG